MKSINEIHLQGRIGQEPRIIEFSNGKLARFAVATERSYKKRDGEQVKETTWHNVVAYEGENRDLSILSKGVAVAVWGRIQHNKYTGKDGLERVSIEVNASTIAKAVDEDEPQERQKPDDLPLGEDMPF